MNSHNEPELLLTFGKKTFDVSNAQYGKKVIAMDEWNTMRAKKDLTSKEVRETTNRLGIYLIRQDFEVLTRRFTKMKSRIELIRRFFLTEKHILKSNEEEYSEFEDWVLFTLTGSKKKDLKTEIGIIKIIKKQIELVEATNPNLSQEKCLELLQTYQEETLEGLTISTPDLQA